MNYFERLIRRALLDAPSRTGAALRDPFENEAPLTLDTPLQKPGSSWPVRPQNGPSAAAGLVMNEERTELAFDREARTVEIAPPTPAPEVSREAPVEVPARRDAAHFEPAERQTALARADAFMQSLQPRLPSIEAPRTQPRRVDTETPRFQAPERVETVHAPAPAAAPDLPSRALQTVQPPRAEPPAPRRRSAIENTPVPAPAAEGRAPVPERAARPTPTQTLVRETIHVVNVVEATSTHAELGAAPPTFGAGQL